MAKPRAPRLTVTGLLSAASDKLQQGGYTRVNNSRLAGWPPDSRVFEDPYAIVAIVAYETWEQLEGGWTDAQGLLVDLISQSLTRGEPKASEGYLVLLTPALLDREARERCTRIRYDTSRVRKLVASGEELKSISDVDHTLLPLLPVSSHVARTGDQSVLQLLPRLLGTNGIDEGATAAVVDAFLQQEALLERLHAYRTRS